MDNTCFRYNIRHLRKSKKLTQSEFGELFGLSKGTISSYEGGHSTPSFSDLVNIRNVLKIDLDSLILSDFSGICSEKADILSEPSPIYGNNESNEPNELLRENFILRDRLQQKESEIIELLLRIDQLEGQLQTKEK